jgi:hypothetical protein
VDGRKNPLSTALWILVNRAVEGYELLLDATRELLFMLSGA